MSLLLIQCLVVFTATFAVYFIFGSGHVECVDADPSIQTAQSILRRGSLRIDLTPPDGNFLHTASPKGGWYSKLGFLMPFLYLPPVLAAKVMGSLTGIAEHLWLHFFISLVNGVIVAALVTILFLHFRWSGISFWYSSLFSGVAAFGTSLFPYTKFSSRDVAQALTLLGTIVFGLHAVQEPSLAASFLWISGAFSAAGILCKQTQIFPLIPLIGMVAYESRKLVAAEGYLPLVIPLILPGVAVALWLLFGWLVFGHPLTLGYSKEVFQLKARRWPTPFFAGMKRQLLSKESFFLHNPILVLVLVASVCGWNRIGWQMTLGLWSSFLVIAAAHAKWPHPMGGSSLGPRFLVAGIPLLCLMLPWIILQESHGPGGFLFFFMAVLSLSMQFINVSVKTEQYWEIQGRAKGILSAPHWWANLILFKNKLKGRAEIYSLTQFGGGEKTVDLSDARTLVGFNFWWLHLRKLSRGSE